MKLTWLRAPGRDAANERSLREVSSSCATKPGLGALTAALALLLQGGCSVIVNSDETQCRKDADCAALLGSDAPYTCRQTYCAGSACDPTLVAGGGGVRIGDAYCKGLGFPTAVCGAAGTCEPGCVADADCGGGNHICIVSKNVCIERECSTPADCPSTLPTVQCNEGRCEDPTWGCIGQPDDRPIPTMPTGTLRVPFYDGLTMMPVLGVRATACPDLAYDATDCATPLPGTATSQGPDGIITVTGLQQGMYFRLRIDPPANNPMSYAGVDFYSQNRVRDVTTTPPVTTFPRASLDAMPTGYSPPISIDPALGRLFTRAFDCQGLPAAGMTLDIDPLYQIGANLENGKANTPTVITYFSNNLPDPGKAERYTDSSGLISVLNVNTQFLVPLSTSVFGRQITATRTRFSPMRITTVHFYPRDYPTRQTR